MAEPTDPFDGLDWLIAPEVVDTTDPWEDKGAADKPAEQDDGALVFPDEMTRIAEAKGAHDVMALLPPVPPNVDEYEYQKLVAINDKALEELMDRMQHGDYTTDAFGKERRRPVNSMVLVQIAKMASERSDVVRVRLKGSSRTADEKLDMLIEALERRTGIGPDDEKLPRIIDAELGGE